MVLTPTSYYKTIDFTQIIPKSENGVQLDEK